MSKTITKPKIITLTWANDDQEFEREGLIGGIFQEFEQDDLQFAIGGRGSYRDENAVFFSVKGEESKVNRFVTAFETLLLEEPETETGAQIQKIIKRCKESDLAKIAKKKQKHENDQAEDFLYQLQDYKRFLNSGWSHDKILESALAKGWTQTREPTADNWRQPWVVSYTVGKQKAGSKTKVFPSHLTQELTSWANPQDIPLRRWNEFTIDFDFYSVVTTAERIQKQVKVIQQVFDNAHSLTLEDIKEVLRLEKEWQKYKPWTEQPIKGLTAGAIRSALRDVDLKLSVGLRGKFSYGTRLTQKSDYCSLFTIPYEICKDLYNIKTRGKKEKYKWQVGHAGIIFELYNGLPSPEEAIGLIKQQASDRYKKSQARLDKLENNPPKETTQSTHLERLLWTRRELHLVKDILTILDEIGV